MTTSKLERPNIDLYLEASIAWQSDESLILSALLLIVDKPVNSTVGIQMKKLAKLVHNHKLNGAVLVAALSSIIHP